MVGNGGVGFGLYVLMLELRRSTAMDLSDFMSISSVSFLYNSCATCSCSYFPSTSPALSFSLLSFGSSNSIFKMLSFTPCINSFCYLVPKERDLDS